MWCMLRLDIKMVLIVLVLKFWFYISCCCSLCRLVACICQVGKKTKMKLPAIKVSESGGFQSCF